MTQADRVLASLQRAGEHGVTQVDWLRSPTPDGGPSITRLAARIQDLKDRGYRFEVRGTRAKCAVYVLVESPDASGRLGGPATLPDASGGLTHLFDPRDLKTPPRGPYDEEWAA